MKKISKSPERMTFQAKSYQERLIEDPNNRNAQAMLDMWQQWREEAAAQEQDTEWQKNNLEYDLRTCEPILTKTRNSDQYAQNLYAALCNMEYVKMEVVPVLREEYWSCSWRHAGGIIADMREQGDYINWYCSGIGDGLGNGDSDGTKGYVAEGTVTDEIKEDLKQLGWLPVEWDEDK